MEKIKSDVPLDCAVFQLSPKRSRYELFVSSGGSTEKLASGLLKPFVAHLKVAKEQVVSAAQSIKLEVGRRKNAGAWFTKGTLERFVRFVSTPEILELVNSSDAEMSQLEAARRIYSQGAGDQLSGGGGSGMTAAEDATKKELLRAIDVRLAAVQQDLSTAFAHAAAAGFNVDTVTELQMFADRFGAHRLNDACDKFISLCERRSNLTSQCKRGPGDQALRSSCGSDMSIDDDPPSPPPHQEPITSQQPNPAPITFPFHHTFSREPSVERDDGKKPNDAVGEKDLKDEASTPDQAGTVEAIQPARRLSVQDRINLFENKQKESSGGKPAVVKPVELRRLSSDVSAMGAAAEKTVLRRWSGASDMSIDLSAEKLDSESTLYTSSTVASPVNKVVNMSDNTAKNSIVKPEIKIIPSLSRVSESRLKEGSDKPEKFVESSKLNSNLVPDESDGLKDQVSGEAYSGSLISMDGNQDNSEEKLMASRKDNSEKFKIFHSGKSKSVSVFGDQGKLKCSQGEDLSRIQLQNTGIRNQSSLLSQIKTIGSKGGEKVCLPNQIECTEPWNESVSQTNLKSTPKTVGELGVFEGVSGSRVQEDFAARYKGTGSDSSSAQQQARSVGETEVVEKKESHTFDKVSSGSVSRVEDFRPQRMKSNRQGSTAELSKKAKVQLNESCHKGNNSAPFSGKVTAKAAESFDSFSTLPPGQAQRGKGPKGNHELNNELKMKANEIEKLFAEHKLNSALKGNSEDSHEPASSLHYSKSVTDTSPILSDNYMSNDPAGGSGNKAKFNLASIMEMIDGENYSDALDRSLSELNVSEGARGKSYDKYIQKRDAKLREDWSSNRAEKEARLKSMQDSLERNKSEMKAKFSGSVGRQGSVSAVRRRAERLRSYNSRSIKKKEQLSLDLEDGDDDDEALDFLEKNLRGERTFVFISSGDGISGVAQGMKHSSNKRSLPSSTPRTSVAPVQKSATKTSPNSGKRRMQPENPPVQSVPNFSDPRNENKPSQGGGKTTRTQLRNYGRNKSTTEEVTVMKEDKSRRLQAMRKSFANPREFRDMSPLDSDGIDLTPIKFDEEVQKSVGTKPFLKKGSRAVFVSQTIPKQRASVGFEPANNVDENADIATGPDDSGGTTKDEREEEFETLNPERHKDLEDEEQALRLDSENFVRSGSENGDGTFAFSRVDQALGSQLPSEIPSSFLPVESVPDWPAESPVSWNSRSQHPFSYPHEMSDVDASVDSPVGSPASWNSHSLNQMDPDAARMRKKWGIAQKPMLVAHSSHNLSRKDMTKGFKRLLKFGRKNRGSESLVDWISATTSEGDDDTEDGRDPASRSSEDLRKSRMGFSQAQPLDDSFNENDFFNESVQCSQSSIPEPPANFKLREDHIAGSSIKAPRSFFSLSSFRSKGNEPKPR